MRVWKYLHDITEQTRLHDRVEKRVLGLYVQEEEGAGVVCLELS